jgi:hypothetical protein
MTHFVLLQPTTERVVDFKVGFAPLKEESDGINKNE